MVWNFHDASLDKVAKGVVKHLVSDEDYIIVIFGGRGKGKSTIEMILADRIYFWLNKLHKKNYKLSPDDFALSDNNFFGVTNSKIKDRLRCSVIPCDEGVELFSWEAQRTSKGYLSKKAITIGRTWNFCYLILIEDWRMLNSYIRGTCVEESNILGLRLMRKGMAKIYPKKYIKRFDYDSKNKRMKYPSTNFVTYFKKIPHDDPLWRDYFSRKESNAERVNDDALEAISEGSKSLISTGNLGKLLGLKSNNTIIKWGLENLKAGSGWIRTPKGHYRWCKSLAKEAIDKNKSKSEESKN